MLTSGDEEEVQCKGRGRTTVCTWHLLGLAVWSPRGQGPLTSRQAPCPGLEDPHVRSRRRIPPEQPPSAPHRSVGPSRRGVRAALGDTP